MKISVNIQPALHSGKSGVGFYEQELLSALLSEDDKNEYSLTFFDLKRRLRPIAEERFGKRARINCCNWFSASLYQMISSFIPVPYSLFFGGKPDVSMFFNYYLPPFVKGKKVLVVYDTVIKDFPETVRFRTKMMLLLNLKRSLRRADRIITISEFSKGQIIKHYGVSPEKITVIPCAADREKYFPMTDERRSQASRTISEKYSIGGEYYLYLGNLEPRKNISRLIEAYAAALKERNDLPKLAIAGGKGWLYEDIFASVKRLGIEDKVVFTGYVADEDVPLMMNGAKAFCFPSLYEGFGMPPLEAMACGVPVIASNVSSLPEVMGDCGITVDPYDVDAISKALIDVLDHDFVLRQRTEGVNRADLFSWEKGAKTLLGVFDEL